jgi:hypothetical protein
MPIRQQRLTMLIATRDRLIDTLPPLPLAMPLLPPRYCRADVFRR